MESNSNKSYLVPIILIVIIVLVAAIYIYQKKNQPSSVNSNTATTQDSSRVLGESTNNQTNVHYTISNSDSFNNKSTEIRQPVNDLFTELTEKIKHPDLYTKQDIMKLVIDGRLKIKIAKNQFNNLNADPKYNETTQSHLQSLTLLEESLDALENALKNSDKDQSELFGKKIEESNKIFDNLKIPK